MKNGIVSGVLLIFCLLTADAAAFPAESFCLPSPGDPVECTARAQRLDPANFAPPAGETIFYRGEGPPPGMDAVDIYRLNNVSGSGSYDLDKDWWQAGLWNTNSIGSYYQIETAAWYGYLYNAQTFEFYVARESGGSVGSPVYYLGSYYDSATGSATWHTHTLVEPFVVQNGVNYYLIIRPVTYDAAGYWWCSNTVSTNPNASMTSTDLTNWIEDTQSSGYEYLPAIHITGQAHTVGSNIYSQSHYSGAGSYDIDKDWYQAGLWDTYDIGSQYQVQSIGWYGYLNNAQGFNYYIADEIGGGPGEEEYMGSTFETRVGSESWHYLTLKSPGTVDPNRYYYFIIRPNIHDAAGYWWCSNIVSTYPHASYYSTDLNSWIVDTQGSGYEYLPAIHVTGSSGGLGSVIEHFEAYPLSSAAIIEWRTTTEMNLVGFNLYRSIERQTGYEMLNEFIIDAHYGDPEGYVYRWKDRPLDNGTTYWYKLECLFLNGDEIFEAPVNVTPGFDINRKGHVLADCAAGNVIRSRVSPDNTGIRLDR